MLQTNKSIAKTIGTRKATIHIVCLCAGLGRKCVIIGTKHKKKLFHYYSIKKAKLLNLE